MNARGWAHLPTELKHHIITLATQSDCGPQNALSYARLRASSHELRNLAAQVVPRVSHLEMWEQRNMSVLAAQARRLYEEVGGDVNKMLQGLLTQPALGGWTTRQLRFHPLGSSLGLSATALRRSRRQRGQPPTLDDAQQLGKSLAVQLGQPSAVGQGPCLSVWLPQGFSIDFTRRGEPLASLLQVSLATAQRDGLAHGRWRLDVDVGEMTTGVLADAGRWPLLYPRLLHGDMSDGEIAAVTVRAARQPGNLDTVSFLALSCRTFLASAQRECARLWRQPGYGGEGQLQTFTHILHGTPQIALNTVSKSQVIPTSGEAQTAILTLADKLLRGELTLCAAAHGFARVFHHLPTPETLDSLLALILIREPPEKNSEDTAAASLLLRTINPYLQPAQAQNFCAELVSKIETANDLEVAIFDDLNFLLPPGEADRYKQLEFYFNLYLVAAQQPALARFMALRRPQLNHPINIKLFLTAYGTGQLPENVLAATLAEPQPAFEHFSSWSIRQLSCAYPDPWLFLSALHRFSPARQRLFPLASGVIIAQLFIFRRPQAIQMPADREVLSEIIITLRRRIGASDLRHSGMVQNVFVNFIKKWLRQEFVIDEPFGSPTLQALFFRTFADCLTQDTVQRCMRQVPFELCHDTRSILSEMATSPSFRTSVAQHLEHARLMRLMHLSPMRAS